MTSKECSYSSLLLQSIMFHQVITWVFHFDTMNINQDSYYSEIFSAPYILFYQFSNDYTPGRKVYCLFHIRLKIWSQWCSKNYYQFNGNKWETLNWEYVGITKAQLNYKRGVIIFKVKVWNRKKIFNNNIRLLFAFFRQRYILTSRGFNTGE